MGTNKQPKDLVCKADGGEKSPCRGLLYGTERRSKNAKKASSGLNAKAYENQKKMRFVMSNQGHSQMSEHSKCARFRLGQRTEKAWRKTPAFCFLSLIQFESSGTTAQGKKPSATCQEFLVFLMTT